MRKGKFFLLSITLIMCMLSGTGILYAQNGPKVTVKMQNATVRDVLKSIEENTDYAFFYNNADFDAKAKVSVNADNQSVESVIAGILPGFTCKFENKKIILVKNHPISAPAQQVRKDGPYEITGVILDSKGEPLVGASALVLHNGKPCGGIADIDGNFTIALPSAPSPDQQIVFSYIGYVDEVRSLGNQAKFNITLKDDTELLAESVVVGYGTQKKVNLTGAVAAITADEFKDRPVASVGQALQGVIPNLNVTMSSGRPGAGANYNIRGVTSPNGGTPLVLVDGVETYLDRINSNDIESISVLMDASSAAIYGARAASGVILVTTKSGKTDSAPKVTADARFSVSANTASTDFETRGYYHAKIVDMFNLSRSGVTYSNYTDEDYQRLYERRNDVVENPERPWVLTEMRDGKLSYIYLANFDWYNWMFDESRPTQDYNINVSGGSKNVTYLVSGRYYRQEGIFRQGPDTYDSFNTRAKIDIKIKPWLKLSSNTKFFRGKYFCHEDDYRKAYLHAIASLVPTNPDGTAVYKNVVMKNNGVMDGNSAMLIKGKQWSRDRTTEVTSSWALTADITKNLKFVADFSYKFGYLRNEERMNTVEYSTYPGEILSESNKYHKNSYTDVVYEQNNYVANAFVAYENTWKDAHNFTATAGVNYEARRYKDLKVSRDDLLSETLTDFNLAKGTIGDPTGGISEFALAGIFYRFTYDWKSRYLVEVNGRYDGSSRFLKGHRWGFFPSVSAAWRISEEPWMQSSKDIVNNLKIRASFGSLGNQNIGYYDYYQKVNTGGTMNWTFDGKNKGNRATVDDPTATGTWEVIETKNIGLDLGLWQDRLTFTGNAFIRDTKGILTRGKPLPSIYGAGEPKVNANDLRTTGWELQLQYKNSFHIGKNRFDYSVGASLADYTAWYTRTDNPSGLINEPYVGKKYGEIWGYRIDGLFDSDEAAAAYASEVNLETIMGRDYASTGPDSSGARGGDMKYLDLNGDKIITSGAGTLEDHGDMEVIGNSTPRYSYSFNGGFNFYGFDFYIFFQGIGRQDMYPSADQEANPLLWGPYGRPYISFIGKDFMKNVWSEDNKDAYYPRPRGYSAHNGTLVNVNDRYLQNLAYLRLKNLTIGYTLPDKWMSKAGISKLRVYFSGENLWYASPLKKYNKYIDPEFLRMGGTVGNAYSMCKTFSFGVTLEF